MVSPRPSPSSSTSPSATPAPNPNPNQETESLHAYLLSCSDLDIVPACRAIETFLLHQPPEATLGFFRLCFPVLIQRLFGFRDSVSSESTAWIVRAAASSSDHDAISAVRSLLHPTAPLFTVLLAIDRENLVRFLFPNERLPLRIRHLLLLDHGHQILSKASLLFGSCISSNGISIFDNNQNVSGSFQLQLNLFEYFMFWFAYYGEISSFPMGGSSYESLVSGLSPQRSSLKDSLGQWVSHPFHHHHHHHHQQHHQHGRVTGPKCTLYLQLLHLYLAHFVQPYHFAGIIYAQGSRELSQGGFLLLTLIEFWLMKDDSWPLDASQAGSIRIDYTPPGAKLCEAVRLLVNYCNSLSKASLEQYHYSSSHEVTAPCHHRMVEPTSSFLLPRNLCVEGDFAALEVRLLQKPLYRFISCAFTHWPSGIPIKQARYLVNVWVDYMQPWNIGLEENEVEMTSKSLEKRPKGYSIIWQGFVTRNYPFYTTLVARFLELALKSVRSNVEAVVDMTGKVLGVLAGQRDLLEHIKRIELSHGSPMMRLDGASAEMDWEESYPLGDTHAYGSAMQESHLSRSSCNSAFQTFQILILQAEMEIQYVPVERQKEVTKALERVKQAGGKIFDFHAPKAATTLFQPQPEMSKPRIEPGTRQPLGWHTCFDVRYRGDWMKRPIESTEIAWLARVLVKISDSINSQLGLDAEPCTDEHGEMILNEGQPNSGDIMLPTPEVQDLDVPKLVKTSAYSFAEESRDLLWRCWVLLISCMRRHGWRVNLRFLARKPFLAMLLLLVLCRMIKKMMIGFCMDSLAS